MGKKILKRLGIVLAIVLTLLLMQFGKCYTRNTNTYSHIKSSYINCFSLEDSMGSGIPDYISNFKKLYPIEYKKVCSPFDGMIANTENAIKLGQSIVYSVMKKLPKSSDETVIYFAKNFVKIADMAQLEGGDACLRMMKRQYVPKLLEKEAAKLMNDILITYNENILLPTKSQVQNKFRAIGKKLYLVYGNDFINVLKIPNYPLQDKSKICRINRDIYKEILNLPRGQAIKVLRFMTALLQVTNL